jgi:hypothetical protein
MKTKKKEIKENAYLKKKCAFVDQFICIKIRLILIGKKKKIVINNFIILNMHLILL